MSDPGADKIAIKLAAWLIRYQDDAGELAEILKAEAQARVDGVQNSYQATITAQKHDGDVNALQYVKESIDYKARVSVDEKWIEYYTMLITTNTIIDVTDLP